MYTTIIAPPLHDTGFAIVSVIKKSCLFLAFPFSQIDIQRDRLKGAEGRFKTAAENRLPYPHEIYQNQLYVLHDAESVL